MKDKESKKVMWTLQRRKEDEYIFVDQQVGSETLEAGWTERFEAIWAMQCAMDFDQSTCKDGPGFHSIDSPESSKDDDIPSRQSSASLSTMPATTVGYR
ncbi:hypothetical protein EON65_44540 [archaeon]|nr:MAG: hypothetical protein EON65_44540 [archaeon]